MLMLNVSPQDSVSLLINGITAKVKNVMPIRIRLGFDAPKEIRILRDKLLPAYSHSKEQWVQDVLQTISVMVLDRVTNYCKYNKLRFDWEELQSHIDYARNQLGRTNGESESSMFRAAAECLAFLVLQKHVDEVIALRKKSSGEQSELPSGTV